MEEVIEPVSKELIIAELTEDKRLRMTNKSNNQIYIITYHDSPNIMRRSGVCVRLPFGLQEVVRGCQWISMSMIRWRIRINN